MKIFISFIFFFLFGIPVSSVFAGIVEYDLDINFKTINISGKSSKAMAINNSIPGPTLRFREGDTARISIKNSMNVETSIHWHGLLLPTVKMAFLI